MHVKLMAMLGNVRILLQVDIGAGDAVVPPPEVLDYPGILDLPRARLRAYRPETSIAERPPLDGNHGREYGRTAARGKSRRVGCFRS